MLPSRVSINRAKKKFSNVNRYKFEVTVSPLKLLANLQSERVDCKEGAPGFIRNLHLYKKQNMAVKAMLQEVCSHFNNKMDRLGPDVLTVFCGLL
jgi:hypothetical protein